MNGGERFHEHGGRDRQRERYRDDRRDRDRDRERDRGDRRERRRSRSPHGRPAGGDRHEEVDSYSRSRDFRAREREDRYTNKQEDRGWERDRGGRGDRDRDRDRDRGDRRRRDDDDRRGGGGGGGGGGGRRDRDLFDRSGGGGRGRDDRGEGAREARRDRDEFAMQARGKKSPTPPPRNREPTPDLTDVVSILERKRRLPQWDIKPPGYENVTAEQAKLSGMFPLPGAPRQQVMDPTRLQSLMNASGGGAEKAALKPSNSRQAKRLVVSNLPPGVTEDAITGFFNLHMNGLNITESSDPCVSCQFSEERGFAMVEFRNPSDATLGLAFDRISMEDNGAAGNGAAGGDPTGLIIRRPKDYIVATISEEERGPSDIVSTNVPDTANKISITNILPSLTEEQVKELLTTFGALRSFVLVRDRGNDMESRGIAFCEYIDPSLTDVAVEGLNGMELGPQSLRVQRASIGFSQADSLEMSVNAMSMLAGTMADNLDEGRVLQLLNMVLPEELMDQQDYEEIVEDVQDECNKFGRVLAIKIPRPSIAGRQNSGVGKIFIKYDTAENAKKAMSALAGRKFADRTVVVTYFSEENFDTNAW